MLWALASRASLCRKASSSLLEFGDVVKDPADMIDLAVRIKDNLAPGLDPQDLASLGPDAVFPAIGAVVLQGLDKGLPGSVPGPPPG